MSFAVFWTIQTLSEGHSRNKGYFCQVLRPPACKEVDHASRKVGLYSRRSIVDARLVLEFSVRYDSIHTTLQFHPLAGRARGCTHMPTNTPVTYNPIVVPVPFP